MPPDLIIVASIALASVALVVYWTVSLSRYRRGNRGPFQVWGFGVLTLFVAACTVAVGLTFVFGMRVGQVAYRAVVSMSGASGGSASTAKTVGIVCGIAVVLLVIGSGLAFSRTSRSGGGS